MRSLLFGISRNHGGQNILVAGNAFTQVLSSALGQPVKLYVADDYEQLLQAVRAATVALAWMPPLMALRLSPAEAPLAAVSERRGSLFYRSALVVANTSPFQSLPELRGAGVRVAWGDPRSAGQYVVPRHHLIDAGLLPGRDFVEERFLHSGFTICAAVANGEVELGAAHCSDDLASDPERVLQDLTRHFTAAPWRLRVLAITEAIPADGIVVTPAVDEPTRLGIGDALHALHTTDEAQAALRALMNADKLVPPSPAMKKSYARLDVIAARVARHPPEPKAS